MRYTTSLLALFFPLLSLLGCGNGSTSPNKMGTLKVSLTDAPGRVEAVNITFSEISSHINDEWIVVRGEPVTVNLLEWNNGRSIVLGAAEVPAGQYTQIRLKIEHADVVVDGQTHSATVPSGAQTGLKLGPAFAVNEGSTYELVTDFDARRSIVTTGPPSNPRGYKLKPTLRVVPKAVTGSISGTVANPQHLPTAYAIVDSDTLTSTTVDTSMGAFMLAFLPEGAYTVAVNDTAGLSFERSNIQVVVGTDQQLGTITLQ